MKNNIQQFVISILVILLLPLGPLIMEHLLINECTDSSLTITAAIYSVTVLVTSQSLMYLIGSIFPCMAFTGFYSFILGGHHIPNIWIWATVTILAVAIVHIVERYRRHIINGEVFSTFQ